MFEIQTVEKKGSSWKVSLFKHGYYASFGNAKQRKSILACVLLFALITIIGCDNAVENELLAYANNSAYAIDHKRLAMVTKVNAAIDDKNVSAADFVNLLEKEIIPGFSQLRLELGELELKTKEVRELNDQLIKAIVSYETMYEYNALASKPGADPELRIKVTKITAETERLYNLWFRQREALLKKFGYQ